jgi:hypothetical protein
VAVLPVPLTIYTVFAVLQVFALVRFHSQVAWEQASALVLAALLAAMAGTGLTGILIARRAVSDSRTEHDRDS